MPAMARDLIYPTPRTRSSAGRAGRVWMEGGPDRSRLQAWSWRRREPWRPYPAQTPV